MGVLENLFRNKIKIRGGYQVKKLWSVVTLTATAVFSGLAMSKFLNWAGEREIFDFDLDEDIDNEELSAL
jgi:hypothetical protein